MNPARISDSRLAALVGVVLTAFAASIVATVTAFPGGFEAQAVWSLLLLPGELLALLLSDLLTGFSRRGEGVAFWMFLISFSWPWYWLVGYCLVKFFSSRPKTWDGF